jgi:hypothetical protein
MMYGGMSVKAVPLAMFNPIKCLDMRKTVKQLQAIVEEWYVLADAIDPNRFSAFYIDVEESRDWEKGLIPIQGKGDVDGTKYYKTHKDSDYYYTVENIHDDATLSRLICFEDDEESEYDVLDLENIADIVVEEKVYKPLFLVAPSNKVSRTDFVNAFSGKKFNSVAELSAKYAKMVGGDGSEEYDTELIRPQELAEKLNDGCYPADSLIAYVLVG